VPGHIVARPVRGLAPGCRVPEVGRGNGNVLRVLERV
jgi:hypothetical protein